MRALIHPRKFGGSVRVPASKSHTVRRLIMASLTEGVSEILDPLVSLDTQSCVSVCRVLGADISEKASSAHSGGISWYVRGKSPPDTVVSEDTTVSNAAMTADKGAFRRCDVGNSGTTLFLALAAAALDTGVTEFDGDHQIRKRSAGPLLDALLGLGVQVRSAENKAAPITVQGPWKGGRVSLPCPTSQYLSAILLAAPLAPAGVVTEIEVPLLNEKPYIEMTLSYLKSQNIPFETAADYSYFRIPGGASFTPINGEVPADFSSAAFPACAAAVSGGSLTLRGLDPGDSQGDKAFFSMLEKMGCHVSWRRLSGENSRWDLEISREGPLKGGVFDLNATPDLLPVMAVLAAYAAGETALVNAAHARIKETDRISAMAGELGKLGVECRELPDGLSIRGRAGVPFRGCVLDGHGDHRIVMALAALAAAAEAPVEISGAEAAAITYPEFLKLLNAEILA